MDNCTSQTCNCCNNCNENVQFGTTSNNDKKLNHIIYGDINNGYNRGDVMDANAVIDLIVSLTQDIISWGYIGYES